MHWVGNCIPAANQQIRLVKASLAKFLGVQWHRQYQIDFFPFPMPHETAEHQPTQRPGQLRLCGIFETVYDSHQFLIKNHGSPRHPEFFGTRNAFAAEMILILPAFEWSPAATTYR
jgi:hypothetical protein